MYIFNLWQLRQGVDSLAQWLEHWIFIREDPGSIPTKGRIFFFSYASFLRYDFHVVRPVKRSFPRFRLFKTCLNLTVSFLLTLPRRFLWCRALFVRRWFHMFFISPSFRVLKRLCYVIVAFSWGIFTYLLSKIRIRIRGILEVKLG